MAPLGALPNVNNSGTGWGYQSPPRLRTAMVGWRRLPLLDAEVTDGDTRVRSETREINLDEFSTKRLGVYGDVSYRF